MFSNPKLHLIELWQWEIAYATTQNSFLENLGPEK